MCECLTDLTGGVSTKLKLDEPAMRELAVRGELHAACFSTLICLGSKPTCSRMRAQCPSSTCCVQGLRGWSFSRM